MRRPENGFTLIELLVALLVFAVMAAMAYGGLNAVMNDRYSLQRALKRTAMLQKAIYRLETDLCDVRPRPIRGRYGEIRPAFRAVANGMVSFTRGGFPNPLDQRRSTLERVAYTLVGHKLERWRWSVLDRAPNSQPDKTTLLKGVNQMTWRFTDAHGQSYAQWPPPNQPDTQAPPSPPSSAEITLKTSQWGTLRLLVPIEAGDNTVQPTAAGTGTSG